MKLHRVVAGAPVDQLTGMVLCHDVTANNVRLRKGQVLQLDDLLPLRSAARGEMHLIELEQGELAEEQAGRRLAAATAGDGVSPIAPSLGHWPLVANRRGVLNVSIDALREANLIEGVGIYTLFDGQIVDADEHVARAKIAPLVLKDRLVTEVERIAQNAEGLIRVRPFLPRRIGVVAAETLAESSAGRIRAVLAEKVSWLGSTLLDPVFVRLESEPLLAAMQEQLAAGAEVLLVAGTRPMDPLDASWHALQQFGVTVERFGVPAHPGSLLWIAWRGDVAILGVPTCGVFSRASVMDVILPRILTGERVGRVELAELGHGGFLTRDYAFRFPPYRGGGNHRGEVEDE